jgi:hypothetical protein
MTGRSIKEFRRLCDDLPARVRTDQDCLVARDDARALRCARDDFSQSADR